MLGRELVASLSSRHEVTALPRSRADITDGDAVARAIVGSSPEVVIHAAAFTAVDECERQPEVALAVNAEGTRNVTRACRAAGARLLYLSTDYVFDGEKSGPYVETDQPRPLNVYGQSKLHGEQYVADLVDRFWIVRVSWLFGPHGRSFVTSILDKAKQEGCLRVVNDQTGAPTYTADLAQKLEEIILRGEPGFYHVTNQGYCSWFDFACEILRQAELDRVLVLPISTSAAGRPARRPKNSCLRNLRLDTLGLGLMPPWQDALRRHLQRTLTSRGNVLME
jgi:dTDP-4-dehydrorhamnose reductase